MLGNNFEGGMIMNTHETYVNLETAKLLKQAGFDWPVQEFYDIDGELNTSIVNDVDDTVNILAPSLSIAQRWLREVKECAVIVETHNIQATCVSAYVYCIYPTDATHPCEHINGFAEDQCFDTYEQAQEAGIKKALEIILEKRE